MPGHAEEIAALHRGLFTTALPSGVTAIAPEEAGRRFAVYRNNVMHGLTTALGQRFPVVERLVGTEFFRAMAADFIRRHPPASPVLLEWGAAFPGFLEGFPPVATLPYLADVARIELLRGAAYHAADTAPVPPDALAEAAADPGRARLVLHPSVALLQSPHAAFSIWQANQPDAPPRPLRADRAEAGAILRDRTLQVQVLPLSPADFGFVTALSRGEPLLAAALAAAEHQPGHEPGTILIRLVALGAVTHIAMERS